MIECVFTLDYEIYGNGTGALKDLIYEPAQQLKDIFLKWNARFVTFVEVAELQKIQAEGRDQASALVTRQVQDLYRSGFEIGLHLHPQWCNGIYDHGRWLLDYAEYNLCTLSRERIAEIVQQSLDYLRRILEDSGFTPLSFRAGNWLFQPTRAAATVLADKGIKIDSSVFKGGLQRAHKLDYRRAIRNGYYWRFSSCVDEPDPTGQFIEFPIYTEMVPFWRMLTSKRIGLQNKGGASDRNPPNRLNRALDLLRFRYPLKLDFCRMTLNELTSMMGRIIQQDRENPWLYKPIVAIGHTKDFIDPQTLDSFLSFLRTNGIAVSTFLDIYSRLLREDARSVSGHAENP
jgi:hypothetical protein